ncbi:MAG TPA: hypothetical protein VH307_24685 [Streptosporangiaceae bacterium]|nr:hypothetical protein [Streptosporangiaceae bacterium]
MSLVAAQPVGCAELADLGLNVSLQGLKPCELIHPDICSRYATSSALSEVSRCAAATRALR